MTIQQRANYGFELKQNGVCNCAMAVLKAYSDKLNVDENTLKNLSSGFAAGMGGMEGTCGATANPSAPVRNAYTTALRFWANVWEWNK